MLESVKLKEVGPKQRKRVGRGGQFGFVSRGHRNPAPKRAHKGRGGKTKDVQTRKAKEFSAEVQIKKEFPRDCM